MSRPTALYLCSGAGISEAGSGGPFSVELAVEAWERAALTYKANNPRTVVWPRSISDATVRADALGRFSGVDAILSSTPCTSYSYAGRKACDEDYYLFLEPVEWVRAFRPRWFVAENVTPVRTRAVYKLAKVRLRSLGYRIAEWIVDAAGHGVPQYRERIFLIATRDRHLPEYPAPAHGPGRRPFKTLRQAIGHLSETEALRLGCARLSDERQWIMQGVPPGGDWRDLDGERRAAVQASLRGKPPFNGLCQRYHWDQVARTVRTGQSCQRTTFALHPGYRPDPEGTGIPRQRLSKDGNGAWHVAGSQGIELLTTRPLSVLECLLLMGALPGYKVLGSVDDRYRQIGAGICPPAWEAVLGAVVGSI